MSLTTMLKLLPPFGSLLLRSLAFSLLLCLAPAVYGQHSFTQWTSDLGLPQNSVRGIVQTPDGFLWVATLNGLARFDGMQFDIFDKSNAPGMSSSRISTMRSGKDGDLWMIGDDSNVMRLHQGTFITLGESRGVHPYSVGAITGDSQDNVWILQGDRVTRWDPQKLRFELETFSSDALHFAPLWWKGTGFWALSGKQLIVFANGRLIHLLLPATLSPTMIADVASDGTGEVWVRTKDKQIGQLTQVPFTLLAASSPEALPDSQDFGLTTRITGREFDRILHFTFRGVDRSIRYNVLIHDNEGNLWVGSEGEGLFRMQRQSIEVISADNGLATDNVYSVLRSKSGDMWVGSWPAGLTRIRDRKVIQIFKSKDGLRGLVTALAEDRHGVLWIGTHGGLQILKDERLQSPEPSETQGWPVAQAIHESPDGSMMVGTARGLFILDGTRISHITRADGLATDDVRAIITDRTGDTWIGGYGGLTRSHKGALTRWTEGDGLPSNNIRSIMQDSAGDIWVGTYDGGIGWLRNGHWLNFNKSNGLFDNGAFQILEDSKRRFWISSNRGIYRVARDQIASVADGRETYVNPVAFGRRDGMLNVECNGGYWPAGAEDEQGNMWFPTQMGVAVVDPDSVQAVEQPPRVIIEAASVDHKVQIAPDRIVMYPDQTNLEITYTALSYTKPEQMTFRYQLEGIDDSWEHVGTRRTAYFKRLPPGNYIFRINARNSDGIRSVKDTLLEVVVIPAFYRRWWFITLVAVCGLLIICLAWAVRVRQLQQAQIRQQRFSLELIASQEKERTRIAAELHDSLGQRLIVISNLALFFLRTKGRLRTEEEKRETVVEISQEASAAMEETRAISYGLRPFQLDRLGLTKAIHALCVTVSKSSEISIEDSLQDIDDAFPEQMRINVYRIVQEALNNIVKHSGASVAKVAVLRLANMVTLNVSDNGHGIPASPKTFSPSNGGFGLTGMQERATSLKGKLRIKSSPERGTLLTFEFPILPS
jgi:signal transduction histidine kinase/ligand-binding sensor domain-containing protein